ncbi:MAG: hypothetical protein HYZ29_20035 [Myxococcales bacterium]|nr:hypothetical protein [Myxococcales bacterium]
MTEAAGDSASWGEVVRAHLSFAIRIYSAEELQRLADEARIAVRPDGSNSAVSYADVTRYIAAVGKVFGETASVSAKLTAMNKARALGLRPPGLRWFT